MQLPQGLPDEAHPIRAPALAQVGRTPPPKSGPLVFKRGFWRRHHRAQGAQGGLWGPGSTAGQAEPVWGPRCQLKGAGATPRPRPLTLDMRTLP